MTYINNRLLEALNLCADIQEFRMTNSFDKKQLFFLLIIFCLVLALMSGHSAASQLYRYKDEQGNIVLNRTIPPEYVGKGYDILSDQGRLVDSIPPALSEQQIAARDAKIERQKRLKQAQEEQEKIDSELKQLYSHPNDAVRILRRRIQDIRGVIQIKSGKIESTKKEILVQQSKAADRQRSGLNIPDALVHKIRNLKKEVANANADIEELNEEMRKVLQEFDIKIKRLEAIINKKASDYPELLESLSKEGGSPVHANQ